MDPNSDPMGVLRLAFAVGIIHIFVGLGAKAYMNIKAHDVWSAICDTVFWWFLIGGLVALLLSSATACSMFGMSKAALPAAAGEIGKYVAIIGAVGIVLTGGRDSKNWGVRIGRGLYSLYGVSSYLGDILSYSRLLALGLATGMIAQVFNMMGAMAGGGIAGAIFFIIIFVIGHTLNFGINVLGAYVHTNRLTYVEFFGKFYEGEGKAFKPFTMNTKYLKVKNGETVKAKKESAK
jgi:V/A-type H+-transporting ATPase subunit I